MKTDLSHLSRTQLDRIADKGIVSSDPQLRALATQALNEIDRRLALEDETQEMPVVPKDFYSEMD